MMKLFFQFLLRMKLHNIMRSVIHSHLNYHIQKVIFQHGNVDFNKYIKKATISSITYNFINVSTMYYCNLITAILSVSTICHNLL